MLVFEGSLGTGRPWRCRVRTAWQGLCSRNTAACSFAQGPAQHLLAQGRCRPRQRPASAGVATPAAQAEAVPPGNMQLQAVSWTGPGVQAGPAPRRAGRGAPSSQRACRSCEREAARAGRVGRVGPSGCLARAQLPRVRPERGLAQRARAAAGRTGRAGTPAHAPGRAPRPGARAPLGPTRAPRTLPRTRPHTVAALRAP